MTMQQIEFNQPSDEAPFLAVDMRQRMIQEAAYYKAEQRGFSPDHELEDWLDAEHEVDGTLGAVRAD
jgi:hypothetical protein